MYLALRMLMTMGINLYATRLVLQNLGIEDMGVYNVVGGIVSMLAVFTGSLTSTINRFLAFELGKPDGDVNRVFCACMNTILIFAGVTLLLLEAIGVWILETKLNIPPESMNAARWVFQFSTITCLVSMISIPYNALIIAHEKMNVFAFFTVFQVILNCLAAFSLSWFENNRLIYYSLFMSLIAILFRIIYQVYCRVKFKESRFRFVKDWSLLKEIGKFSGIMMIDGIIVMLFYQGFALMLNVFCGVAINGVYMIAGQIRTSIISFAQNVQKAIEPPIIKAYSAKDYKHFSSLICLGSKYQLFLATIIFIPFFFRHEQILGIWLKNVPPLTNEYSLIMVGLSAIYAFQCPIITGALSTGKIRDFLLKTDLIYVLGIPLIYFIRKSNNSPILMIVSFVIIETLIASSRVYFFSKISPIKIGNIIKNTIFPFFLVLTISVVALFPFNDSFSSDSLGLVYMVSLSLLIVLLSIYVLGLKKEEKRVVKDKIIRLFR